jgi:ParB-like chromosome segregation protein Spo0J
MEDNVLPFPNQVGDDLDLPAFLDRRQQGSTAEPSETKPKGSWRDAISIHPAAELFPRMTEAELRELGLDIKTNGLKNPVVLFREPVDPTNSTRGHKYSLLDGIERLKGAELAGVPFFLHQENVGKFRWTLGNDTLPDPIIVEGIDPYTYVLSANIHRRHLTPEQKRELIAKLLEKQPHKSDRAIGKMAKADKNTVAAVRKAKEARGEIHHVKKRTDTKGRKQPAYKPRRPQVPSIPVEQDALVADAETAGTDAESSADIRAKFTVTNGTPTSNRIAKGTARRARAKKRIPNSPTPKQLPFYELPQFFEDFLLAVELIVKHYELPPADTIVNSIGNRLNHLQFDEIINLLERVRDTLRNNP